MICMYTWIITLGALRMSLTRKEEEPFEDFKVRRKLDNLITKQKLKGRIFWDTPKLGIYQTPEDFSATTRLGRARRNAK